VERTAAEEPRPVEVAVAAVEDEPEPLDELQDPLPGTPLEELALYQRPVPAYATAAYEETDAGYRETADPAAEYGDGADPAYAEPDYADAAYAEPDYPTPDYAAPEYPQLQNHAEPVYPEPEAFEDDYLDPVAPPAGDYPAMELDTAEYALPGLAEPRRPEPAQGQLDAMFETGDWAQPHDVGRRLPRAALAVAGAALALVGLGGILLNVASGSTTPAAAGNTGTSAAPAGTGRPPAGAGPGASEVTAARDGRTSANFELVSDASSVDLHVEDLGDDLYKITTPAGGPVRPDATTDGDDVRLSLSHVGPDSGPVQVGVVLNSQVQWTLRIAGGVETGTFDLRGGTIGGVDLTGGAGRFDLSLPRPKGTLSVRMSGGVNVFQMETDGKVPVRVTARSGAGQIILDGTTNNGVARGASFRSPGWSAETNRIDLDAVAGFGTLRVSYD
jgi:hypothetical protein